ncbi:hypothetical protein BGZ61DRAFT_543417 [Ilyonectria robusta]|uniref:uncharacterized protein n=1 Tax=Ilyonectria robusta TaxID=1079257 RepID=UPI001E8E0DF2|nr:uncharacterized protein BGZ61DRAFT_543417 [Ilyonectria robusta]KAH8737277.1 hypothetical protein BGZ61DRAFT_543417 [Ilyonectria robusta]
MGPAASWHDGQGQPRRRVPARMMTVHFAPPSGKPLAGLGRRAGGDLRESGPGTKSRGTTTNWETHGLGLGGLGTWEPCPGRQPGDKLQYTGEPALGGLEVGGWREDDGLGHCIWIAYSFLKTRLAHAPDPLPRSLSTSRLSQSIPSYFPFTTYRSPFPHYSPRTTLCLSLSLCPPLPPRSRRLHQVVRLIDLTYRRLLCVYSSSL